MWRCGSTCRIGLWEECVGTGKVKKLNPIQAHQSGLARNANHIPGKTCWILQEMHPQKQLQVCLLECSLYCSRSQLLTILPIHCSLAAGSINLCHAVRLLWWICSPLLYQPQWVTLHNRLKGFRGTGWIKHRVLSAENFGWFWWRFKIGMLIFF